MQHPVGQNAQDFKQNWYNAQLFGTKVSANYYHEADDLNLKSGGDSDLGEPLLAVDDGKIVYYHNSSHPTKGFGRHMVLEVDTPEGKRWFHYAHCSKITAKEVEVKKGDKIGELGESGTEAAHCHFACFIVDPATLRDGIDTIARNTTELNKWWTSPIKFIEKYLDTETSIDWEKILKKKLPNEAWEMLTEFNDLLKAGLIKREDSIQTQTQKWLEGSERHLTAIAELSNDNSVLKTEMDKLNRTISLSATAYEKLEKTIETEKAKAYKEGKDNERDRIMLELEIRKAGEPKPPADFDFKAWKVELLKDSESKFNKFISYLTQIWQTSPKIQ